jgi:hypothetical protein
VSFNLTEQELQNAFEAIEHHGYSGLVPTPPEWQTVCDRWNELKPLLAGIDLDDYVPNKPMVMFAPKTRATVRPISLLHPTDLLIYSALVLIVKDDLEAQRIALARKRVFSYRANGEPNRFYAARPSFQDFFEISRRKAARSGTSIVGIADIADFFPRIYLHRLENVVYAAGGTPRAKAVARVLVRKFLGHVAGRNSYGIPIGPYASRVLAEAVLTDVDATLQSDGIDFIRWVDDYTIFCKTESQAQLEIFRLSELLFNNHGLTLSAIKTKIIAKENFQERFLQDPEREVDADLATLETVASRHDPYADEEIELSEVDIAQLQQLNFQNMLETALADRDLVDYERLKAILGHRSLLDKLSAERRGEMTDVLLDNMEHLYPIAEVVAQFFRTFTTAPARIKRRIAKRLLASIKSSRGRWPPDYQMAWVLSVLTSAEDWGCAPKALRIFNTHPSDVVRRFAALALYANGSRAEVVTLRAEYTNASPLTRLAILLASRKLGQDERRHWRQTLHLTGELEGLL